MLGVRSPNGAPAPFLLILFISSHLMMMMMMKVSEDPLGQEAFRNIVYTAARGQKSLALKQWRSQVLDTSKKRELPKNIIPGTEKN